MVGNGVADIVAAGKRLAESVPEELSTHLPPVPDPDSGLLVPSWRNNGAQCEHPLHQMMSRVGGFPPSLVRYFIALYSKVGDTVLDPFCGKGTALFEAACMGRAAIGGDIAPDAVLVSRAKCNPVSVARLANYIEGLRVETRPHLPDVPSKVRLFFSNKTLSQILSIRAQLLEDMQTRQKRDVATFACGVMLGLLHGHSRLSLSVPCNQVFAMSPSYVRRYIAAHGLTRPYRDVRECLLKRSLELLPAPRMRTEGLIAETAAEECHKYVRRSGTEAHLIITSPPYLNRQTYIKDSWLRLWFLGRSRVEQAAKSLETGSVSSFVEGIKRALASMTQSLREGGRMVLVCGRAKLSACGKIRQIRIMDLCLYALDDMLESGGLELDRVIRDRKLMKRGSYFAVHRGQDGHGHGGVARRYGQEEIVVLRKGRA